MLEWHHQSVLMACWMGCVPVCIYVVCVVGAHQISHLGEIGLISGALAGVLVGWPSAANAAGGSVVSGLAAGVLVGWLCPVRPLSSTVALAVPHTRAYNHTGTVHALSLSLSLSVSLSLSLSLCLTRRVLRPCTQQLAMSCGCLQTGLSRNRGDHSCRCRQRLLRGSARARDWPRS
jgi:hypothetical protein